MKVDYDLVYNVYLEIRSNIRNKKSIFYFELLLDSNINYIVNKINNNDYKLSKYNIFFIKEKKYRLILSNNIYDKIYTHLVSNIILSKLDKYLINSNVASRIGRGTSYGRSLLHKYICKLKRNNKEFYILKFDIKKYFFNIDHEVLINKLSKYLNNLEINIIKDIINSTNLEYINENIKLLNDRYLLDLPIYKNNKGLSIGSVCSEMLAIFYLNDFDHLIKEKLGCKYYIRYMDDGIILMNNKEKLKKVFNVLKKEIKDYKLEFNSKTKIYKSLEGFFFQVLVIMFLIIEQLKELVKEIKRKSLRELIILIINFIKIILNILSN